MPEIKALLPLVMLKNLLLLLGTILAFRAMAQDLSPVEWPREGQAQILTSAEVDVLARLGVHSPERMEVLYFDYPGLLAKQHGVYLRLRLRDTVAEVTFKYRRSDLVDIPAGADCELDVTGQHAMPSCSWETEVSLAKAQAVVRGQAKFESLMSATQREKLRELMGADIPAALVGHGPVAVDRYKLKSGESGSKWRLEVWSVKSDMSIFEVSYRESGSVAVERIQRLLTNYLTQQGLARVSVERSKTDIVLESHVVQDQ